MDVVDVDFGADEGRWCLSVENALTSHRWHYSVCMFFLA